MELPHLGEQCTNPTCNQLDYLPMKCDACSGIFCREHVSYANHDCPSAYKKNVQVPICPLCNIPIPVKRGELPDYAVGAHIDSDCQSDPAKNRRKVFTNKCSKKSCKVKEVVPCVCNDCQLNFCLKHRHPADHGCEGASGATRRRAAEAALARQSRSAGGSSSASASVPKTSNPFRLPAERRPQATFSTVQGALSEDEALARALALSLEDPAAGQSHGPATDEDAMLARAIAESERLAAAQNRASKNHCSVA